jgi:hypothetical protein
MFENSRKIAKACGFRDVRFRYDIYVSLYLDKLDESTPGPVRPEGLGQFKKYTSSGLEPATFRLAA